VHSAREPEPHGERLPGLRDAGGGGHALGDRRRHQRGEAAGPNQAQHDLDDAGQQHGRQERRQSAQGRDLGEDDMALA